MTQSHTPTPWEVQRHDHDDGTIGYEIWANGQYICSMPVFDEVDEASAKANAAYIVKAVNAYEALVEQDTILADIRLDLEATQKLNAELVAALKKLYDAASDPDIDYDPIYSLCDAALEKAGAI